MLDLEKKLRDLEKMNKKNKPLKKFRGDGGEADTKLEPYKRSKLDLRDLSILIEKEDLDE